MGVTFSLYLQYQAQTSYLHKDLIGKRHKELFIIKVSVKCKVPQPESVVDKGSTTIYGLDNMTENRCMYIYTP